MNVVDIYIPDEVGISNTSNYYFGGSNLKGGIIKNFILENIPNAIVLSDNDPSVNVARVIDIAITDYFVINITSAYHDYTVLYGRVRCSLKGTDMSGPLGENFFQSGYISFYENNDFFGLGRQLCGETCMINKQRKILFFHNKRLYKTFSQTISYEGDAGLYTTLSSSNKARLIQPSIKIEGVPISQYLFSISSSEISALGINITPTNQMLLLRDEDNNVWGLLNTLLFK